MNIWKLGLGNAKLTDYPRAKTGSLDPLDAESFLEKSISSLTLHLILRQSSFRARRLVGSRMRESAQQLL
jgi:hypothetical protein